MPLSAAETYACAYRLALRQRRRTALPLAVLIAVLAAGCSGETPTGADLTADTESVSAPGDEGLSPDLAPSFSTTALTNQPSGFTPIAEWSASSMMPLNTFVTSGYGVIRGRWGRFYNSTGTTARSDSYAPKSSSGTLQFRLPAGMAPGSSYGLISTWSTSTSDQYSKLYESGWIKIPSSNFEVHGPSMGLKLFGLWGAGLTTGSKNQNAGWAAGIGTNPVSKFVFVLKQQNIVTRNLTPNVDTRALFTAGGWHRYEILMEINSIGQANGKFQMWWNGIKTHNYTNVVYRTSTYPAKFTGRKYDPVWGGNGGPNKSREDKILFDHIYISGVK
jgi:hypothetical protein